jgi:hypothetical protein
MWLRKELSGPLCRAASVVVAKQSCAVLKPPVQISFAPCLGGVSAVWFVQMCRLIRSSPLTRCSELVAHWLFPSTKKKVFGNSAEQSLLGKAGVCVLPADTGLLLLSLLLSSLRCPVRACARWFGASFCMVAGWLVGLCFSVCLERHPQHCLHLHSVLSVSYAGTSWP